MSVDRIMWLAKTCLMLNLAGAVWCLWTMRYGILWGSVIWFVFLTAGFWLAHLSRNKAWPK